MRLLVRLFATLVIALLTLVGHVHAQTPVASPGASPVAGGEREVSFESGPDTLYGSLRVPAGATGPGPAVLIISGSGPTDRNGDQPGLPAGTNRHFADELEAIGVVSFRYDKIGSGETGLGTHPMGEGVDYELFLQEAWDAFELLALQPEVDPERIIVLGHSEGALFALDMAADESRDVRPAGIVLAAPVGERYLDLLRGQIGAAYDDLVEAGQLPEATADALREELDTAIAEIRETGSLGIQLTDPGVAALLSPINMDFLYQIDQRDPAELAANVPSEVPVLILHGLKDEQVLPHQPDRLEIAFAEAGHPDVMRVDIEHANHIFRVIEGEPNAAEDYLDPTLPFSPDVGEALETYLEPFLGIDDDA